jgi:hypothetical protein
MGQCDLIQSIYQKGIWRVIQRVLQLRALSALELNNQEGGAGVRLVKLLAGFLSACLDQDR